jgi:hypothetical protein
MVGEVTGVPTGTEMLVLVMVALGTPSEVPEVIKYAVRAEVTAEALKPFAESAACIA